MVIKLAIVFGLIAVVLFLVWFVPTLRQQKTTPPPSGDAQVVVLTDSGEEVVIPVEVAATSADKFRGLSGREALEEGSGMLFVWDQNIQTTFVMRQMEFPLDILFIRGKDDGSGTITHIAADLPACPGQTSGCATASAPESFRWVLEVDAGFSALHGIKPGNSVRVRYAE